MKSNLRSTLKKMIEEILGEMSTTGGVAGYSTPFAFSTSKNGNEKSALKGMPGGKIVDETKEKPKTKETPKKPAPARDVSRSDLDVVARKRQISQSLGDKSTAGHLGRIEKAIKKHLKMPVNETMDAAIQVPIGEFNKNYDASISSLVANLVKKLNSTIVGKTINIDAKKNNPNIPVNSSYQVEVKSINFVKSNKGFSLVIMGAIPGKADVDEYFVEIGTNLVKLQQQLSQLAQASQPKPEPAAQPKPTPDKPAQAPAQTQTPDASLEKQMKK